MFDINAIINDAITAAVEKATAPLLERIAALENQALVVSDAVDKRISGLETATQTEEMLQHLDNQEWFWGKIRTFTDTVVEQAIENHTEYWDHNDFVTEDKLDDYAKGDDIRDAVRDIMEGATVSIRI